MPFATSSFPENFPHVSREHLCCYIMFVSFMSVFKSLTTISKHCIVNLLPAASLVPDLITNPGCFSTNCFGNRSLSCFSDIGYTQSITLISVVPIPTEATALSTVRYCGTNFITGKTLAPYPVLVFMLLQDRNQTDPYRCHPIQIQQYFR